MGTRKSVEDYLEVILVLGEHVHAVDIANRMNISKAAVTKALKNLINLDFVSIVSHHIVLTDSGRAYAEKVYYKHKLLTDFWVALGVDEETAERDACQMEHILSESTMQAIKKYIEEK